MAKVEQTFKVDGLTIKVMAECAHKQLQPFVTAGGRTIYGVSECQDCGAVYGQCYLGDSYEVVKPGFETERTDQSDAVYYALRLGGNDGITRRHGWCSKTTRRIYQAG